MKPKSGAATVPINSIEHVPIAETSGMGRVSRVLRMRNYTRDEGWPFVFGDQEPISSHRELLRQPNARSR